MPKKQVSVFIRSKNVSTSALPLYAGRCDCFIELSSGKTAILEIKNTNYNAQKNWWKDGEKIVPLYYECQGRHYLAVMNVNEVWFCCLYGNNEDEVIIRHLVSDASYEEELIALEDLFWNDNVLAQVPPPFMESGDLISASSKRHTEPANSNAPALELDAGLSTQLARYLALQEG